MVKDLLSGFHTHKTAIVGDEKAQYQKEDGKLAIEGVNDAPAATKDKTTTLSTE
jgi:hypothetical protein